MKKDTIENVILVETDEFACDGCFYEGDPDGITCHRPADIRGCMEDGGNYIYVLAQ
jgi:hypothetical protein